MTLLMSVVAIALAVLAVLRILEAPLGRSRSRRPQVGPSGRRAASSRLLIALGLTGVGAAFLIVVAVRWIGNILQGILS